jgi:GrpB-like predicted nucleotidyltransferase (UPF0157 family)
MDPRELEGLGLGLPKTVVRLVRAEREWSAAAERLIDAIRRALGRDVAAVEHIGSTAVPDLLAKPIVDLAARLAASASEARAVARLEAAGWEYRGDAGNAGGLVFVLDVRRDVRVANLHVVHHDDAQWPDYLAFRDRLRIDPAARAEYERVKTALAAQHVDDREAYTEGKNDVVQRLRRR